VIPAARPASYLQHVISRSAVISVPLVILCSRQAQVSRIAERVRATFGARGLVIDVPEDYQLPQAPSRTSLPRFREANFGRSSDLSVKRNIGLLLARMRGWQKILFIDDDVAVQTLDIDRIAGQLDRHAVAGMRCKEFPDNSVVCHARRLAGLPQDVFVTGAVLGVNTQRHTLSFFPDIYNEDWLFFASSAAGRALPCAGEARQAWYDPFRDPARARREEFGDLLAEGLYSWFETTPGWDFAEQLTAVSVPRYWEHFIEARHELIAEVLEELRRRDALAADDIPHAMESLRHAEDQLSMIDADLCVEFLEAWREDVTNWGIVTQAVSSAVMSQREALDKLGLVTWESCGLGAVDESSVSRMHVDDSQTLFTTPGPVGERLVLAPSGEA
jgi:hypothetical protein